MAKRRRRDRILAGLGEGLANAGNVMLRTQMQERAQDRIDARAQAGQEALLKRQGQLGDRTALITMAQEAAKTGDIDPSALRDFAKTLGINVDDSSFEELNPLPRRLDNSSGKQVAEADKPEKLPTDSEIAGVTRRRGGVLPAEWSEGMIPATMHDGSPDPFAGLDSRGRAYADTVGTKRRSLREAPTQRVTVKKDDGSTEEQFVSSYGGPIKTSPDATQQGVIAANESIAKQKAELGDDALTTLKGTTEARIQNLVEGLTRQAKVQTAAATAGATKRAGLAPDIIAAEVDRAQKLAAGKENSTESERRAATNWAPLVKAHATALEMENAGARIGTGDNFMTKVPLLNRAVPEGTKQYMQAARDFISTLGLIRSGVTVRPDEAESLFSTMFGTTGDGATTLRNKQQSREVFLASMQAMVGRSGDEAGRILATAINNKQIPQEALSSLSFDNEELKRALLANLKGIPVFDLSGNPIGVR